MWAIRSLLVWLQAVSLVVASKQYVALSTPKSSLLSDDLVHRLKRVQEKWRIPGVTIAVVASPKYTGDKWEIQTVQFGIANAANDAVTNETMFSIASNSKLFTMLSVGLLIRNGTKLASGQNLDWSTKIKDVIPEWKLMDEYASDHTDLIDLANMRTGLSSHDLSHGPQTPREWIANLRNLKPSAEFRQAFQYNNGHYTTLSEIVPTLTGVPFVEYVKDHILDPLGMTQTYYNSTLAGETGNRVQPFFRSGVDETKCAQMWKATKDVDETCLGEPKSIGWWTTEDGIFEAGPGAIVMSGRDMAIWIRELLDPRIIPRELLVKATDALAVMSETFYPELSDVEYGMAQTTRHYRSVRMVGHTGGLPGQYSALYGFPTKGFAVMLALNDEFFGPWFKDIIGYSILDELLGMDPIDWEDRIVSRYLGEKETSPPLLEHPRAFPESKDVVGTYHAEGYGNFTLQEVNSHHPVLNALEIPSNTTIYLASTGKLFAAQIAFIPYDGPKLRWYALSVYPIHTDTDKGVSGDLVSAVVGYGDAIWINKDGIGMFGNYWSGGVHVGGRPVQEDDVQESSEVWYRRIA
ncbi:beta-lactamase/transpeptidase-like protein [Naematelia encephala]|uniref:Beta-lactamase/transpeptidase-like protein n=1 Tax=Naematelia encephala TaxID=71784 RepID=A0A1Y2BBE4_9TREE|nr:beta-lactamase/transpeptidase-like protein [Naematelia encephala]